MKHTLYCLVLALAFAGCNDRNKEIASAMHRYDRQILHLATDSIADTYTTDGELGGQGMKTIVGRDSIRHFLKSFEGAMKLLSVQTRISAVAFSGDTAHVDGAYEQKALKAPGDTGVYTGLLAAIWVHNDNRWMLKKMYTMPNLPKATIKSVLLRQFKSTHVDKEWFVPANTAIEGLTAKQAMWTDGSGNHSVGQLASHLIFWNERLLRKFKNEPEAKFSGNNEETFPNTFDEKSWAETVKKLDDVFTSWETAIAQADDKTLEGWYENIANMSTHNAYHTGQIIFLRKLQGTWNPEKGVK